MTEYSTNAICYEAIQRRYRNAAVRHIRKKFKSAFPDDYQDKLKHPFTEEECDYIPVGSYRISHWSIAILVLAWPFGSEHRHSPVR